MKSIMKIIIPSTFLQLCILAQHRTRKWNIQKLFHMHARKATYLEIYPQLQQVQYPLSFLSRNSLPKINNIDDQLKNKENFNWNQFKNLENFIKQRK